MLALPGVRASTSVRGIDEIVFGTPLPYPLSLLTLNSRPLVIAVLGIAVIALLGVAEDRIDSSA
jgi:hypothetical protein